MFRKLLALIKEALRRMTVVNDLGDVIESTEVYTISDKMQKHLEIWESLYEDDAPWLDDEKGVYSLGLAPLMCSVISNKIINEFKSTILEPGQDIKDVDESKDSETTTRATYLNNVYHKNLLGTLTEHLEHSLAVGGMIIKPYVSNDKIYYDYCMQGEFIPLGFNDDGVIYDIAFYDDFLQGDQRYRRVERHVWDESKDVVTVINSAYVAKVNDIRDKGIQLGTPVALKSIPRWSQLEETQTIQDVEKPLYGYYKFAKANNVDPSSPLGISLFSRATRKIKRADIQYSRLDWEYEGGQLAVDVDILATKNTETGFEVDQLRKRLYRKLDFGAEGTDTYNVFAPTLRDDAYLRGLNRYLMDIEDTCEIARGTISEVQSEARTATELKILQNRAYDTISNNQKALESCLDDVIYASNVLIDLYGLAPDGDYTTVHEWSDSVLSDTNDELQQKISLLREKVISKAEVRAWYNGEDIETAKKAIEEIEASEQLLDDIFTDGNNNKVTEKNKDDDGSEPKNQKEEKETKEE